MRLARVLVPAVVLACVFAAGADAGRGPCTPGKARPLCYHWKAKVTFVADGDTIVVNPIGDGRAARRKVRLSGINAMEQTVYSHRPDERRGHCHALAATARLGKLIRQAGNRVRLSAQRPSSRSGPRLRRLVSVWSNGGWVDLGQIMVDEGHVLFHSNGVEWARNKSYSRGAQRAARAGYRLWDTDHCGTGPAQGARLRMWVNWDADGTDGRRNLNGEWVKIKNVGSSRVSISRWWFRDSHLRRFRFPRGTSIPAGKTIRLSMGRRPRSDSNRRSHFYWGQGTTVFENVDGRRGVGDGGYLFDRQGDLRVWMMYPCRVACRDPLKGKVNVRARPQAPEKVFVRNVSSGTVRLEGYVVDNYPYNYSFPKGAVLRRGETLRLIVKGSARNNKRLVRYWGKTKYILNDPGDRVSLRTQRNVRIDCYAWGSRHC
jgi:endonuclease YncB( thermonuclease family)